MNQKGFTLIELVTIVALLGVISLVAYSGVNNSIKRSNEELYKAQMSNIKAAAKDWTVDNLDKLPVEDKSFYQVSLGDLKTGGYIADNLIDPKTKKELKKTIYVKITKNNNNYLYEVIDQ
ncbi:MAG: prepilin-type N-terminal cleavage/methylation domain-containing protein [Bacilli bacterium]